MKNETRDNVSFWATIVALIIGAAAMVVDIIKDYTDLSYPGFIGAIMDCSSVWLPILMLVIGFGIGYQMRKRSMNITSEQEITNNHDSDSKQSSPLNGSKDVAIAVSLLSGREKAELWTAYDLEDVFDPDNYYFRNANMLYKAGLLLKLGSREYRINPLAAQAISGDEGLRSELEAAWENSDLCIEA